jgi:hypothetical protein
MNISTDTLAILKNFSEINQNILFRPGKKLNTISQGKNILAEADITEKFDAEFGVYDLPEFLRAVELFNKPALKFNGGEYVTIADEATKQAIRYFFSDKSVVLSVSKGITMPDKTVTFTLKKDDYAKLLKVCNTLNLPDVAVKGDGKSIKIVATDKKNKSSNDWSLTIGETDKTFTAYFRAENFKIINDDYDVSISKQKISHFINRTKPIQYWIALEPDSEF